MRIVVRTFLVSCALFVSASAFADDDSFFGARHHHAAPAPLIGTGISSVAALGVMIWGSVFLRRKK